eukprot:m.298840 g.298840  ORF g.298840 m.298840 type:complete len:163 (+) comp22984_c0_seq1:461-949(+)
MELRGTLTFTASPNLGKKCEWFCRRKQPSCLIFSGNWTCPNQGVPEEQQKQQQQRPQTRKILLERHTCNLSAPLGESTGLSFLFLLLLPSKDDDNNDNNRPGTGAAGQLLPWAQEKSKPLAAPEETTLQYAARFLFKLTRIVLVVYLVVVLLCTLVWVRIHP